MVHRKSHNGKRIPVYDGASHFYDPYVLPPIRDEEEKNNLIQRARYNGQALEVIVRSHIPFVMKIAKECLRRIGNYGLNGLTMDDAIGWGMVGLVRAVRYYEPARGKFTTYAGVSIRNAIEREERQGRLVRAPEWTWQVIGRVSRFRRYNGRDPAEGEIRGPSPGKHYNKYLESA